MMNLSFFVLAVAAAAVLIALIVLVVRVVLVVLVVLCGIFLFSPETRGSGRSKW